MTGNLHFEDYDQVGDHADFLWHFIQKHGILAKVPQEVRESVGAYLQAVECLPRAVRVMSIVSRERELSGIFERILEAPDWSLPGLAAFRYYLEEHIKLDSNEGGHADLLAGCEVDERVVEFYERRLDLYRCMPTLFTKRAMQKLGEVQVLG